MQIARIRKWFLYVVIGSVVMYLLGSLLISKDRYKEEVERFLETNSEVQAQIGEIQSVKLFRVTSVQATEREPAYRLYYFDVKGKNSMANIIVRAEETSGQSTMSYSIDSIKRENR